MNDTSSAAETELMKNLYGELKKKGLPSYAAPRLVRLMGMYVYSPSKPGRTWLMSMLIT